MDLQFGRKSLLRCAFRTVKDGIDWKIGIIEFQLLIASGKNERLKRFVEFGRAGDIKIGGTVPSFCNLCAGSLSLRYFGLQLFTIL